MGYLSYPANYDKFPAVRLKGITGAFKGKENIAKQIAKSLPAHRRDAVIAIDSYPGVDVASVQIALGAFSSFAQAAWFYADISYIHANELDARLADTLSVDHVFDIMRCTNFADYLLLASAKALKQNIEFTRGLSIIISIGASFITECDLLIYDDNLCWHRQLDWRTGGSNWLAVNHEEDIINKYKRSFCLKWCIADRHKRDLFSHFDYYLDTLSDLTVMIDNAAFQASLDICLKTAFKLNHFFDPGMYVKNWMKKVCALPTSKKNYAWCFDVVPKENILTLTFNSVALTMPVINLVLACPEELLIQRNYAQFVVNFPIRFDFLNIMSLGNLSVQIHPSTNYIQQHFGMHYTKDESYYTLDGGENASVWLGFPSGVKQKQLVRDIDNTQQTGILGVEKFVNRFTIKKHDHVLIPSCTVHCSGKDAMILEISATTYTFTFKLWDCGRLYLDGKHSPMHLHNGSKMTREERDTVWCHSQLINTITLLLQETVEWQCERTELHTFEFIDTHRYWINGIVDILTDNEFQMLNLIEWKDAVIENLDGLFATFIVHYAKIMVIIATLDQYTIRSPERKEIVVIMANICQAEGCNANQLA